MNLYFFCLLIHSCGFVLLNLSTGSQLTYFSLSVKRFPLGLDFGAFVDTGTLGTSGARTAVKGGLFQPSTLLSQMHQSLIVNQPARKTTFG